MTPQEQALVNELFDRLAKLESNSRDRDAERLIADGLRQAPHAVYALVQTALVQDEALKLANAADRGIAGAGRRPGATARRQLPRQHARCRPRQERAAKLRYAHQDFNPIDHNQDIRPMLRVPVWHRAWARPLVRAGRFWARPPRRRRA